MPRAPAFGSANLAGCEPQHMIALPQPATP